MGLRYTYGTSGDVWFPTLPGRRLTSSVGVEVDCDYEASAAAFWRALSTL